MAHKITSTFDFPTDPQFWQNWFTQDVNRPISWILSARDLLEHLGSMADDLRAAWIESHRNMASSPSAPPRGLHRVYLFLAALTIENLLKAIIVNNAKWPDSQIAQKIPEELHSHVLLDLATAGGFALTVNDVELLERITEFGIWIGRYPAPTKLHLTKPKRLRSGIVNLAGYMHGSDIREVEDIVNRLVEELKVVQGIEHLAPFPPRAQEDFVGVSISPNIRPW